MARVMAGRIDCGDLDLETAERAVRLLQGDGPRANQRGGDPGHLPPTGDLNTDCWVTLLDFALLAAVWRVANCQAPDWCGGADFDENGTVDAADQTILTNNWGACTQHGNGDRTYSRAFTRGLSY